MSRRWRFSIASSTVKRGRTPRNSATSPRQLLRSTITVGRFVSRASSTRAVDRHRRRPGTPLGAEERRASRRAAGRPRSPPRGAPPSAAPRRGTTPPSSATPAIAPPASTRKLVRSRAHRLKDQVGLGADGNREDRHRRLRGAQPLDRRHAGRGIGADVDDDDVGRRVRPRRASRMPIGTPHARSSCAA